MPGRGHRIGPEAKEDSVHTMLFILLFEAVAVVGWLGHLTATALRPGVVRDPNNQDSE